MIKDSNNYLKTYPNIFIMLFLNNCMKSKRGQVTVFIIVAILIIAIIVLFFIFRSKILPEGSTEIQEQKMQAYIENCISIGLVDGARLVGLQGGYLEAPENAVKLDISNVAYGYYLGSNTLNSKSRIENEIASYMELTLPFCLDEEDFPEYTVALGGEVESKTTINKDSISTITKFPIGISKGDSSVLLNPKYELEVPINLGDIYETAEKIINKEIENPNFVSLTYLSELNYAITIISYNEKIVIYSISDENLDNPEYEYIFRFASRTK